MRIFYNIDQKHLIAVPYRNGSSHLHINAVQYKLTNITYAPIFKSVIDEVEKKTFIYRDPCIRFLSYYNQFVYEESQIKSNKYNPERDQIFKLFKPMSRGEDLLSDILLAKDKIIKNYTKDFHTRPQISYFTDESYEQDLKDYEIISIDQYIKWLKLTFNDTVTQPITSKVDKLNITSGNFRNMQKIQELCTTMYEDDYVFLEPNITYL